MIFNNTINSRVDESPYELGVDGALMHVYESELNYNALMKAAAISELKYYNETGGDLFVNEAGAFKSFADKIIGFFKKVIEKIKRIFTTFIAKIDSFRLDDEKFLKKYRDEIKKKNLKDFKFEGYEFSNLSTDAVDTSRKDIADFGDTNADNYVETKTAEFRGLITKNDKKDMNSSQMIEAFKKKLYGEKKSMSNIDINKQLGYIGSAKTDIENAGKLEKQIIDSINASIDGIKKQITQIENEKDAKGADDNIKAFNTKVQVYKNVSSIYTTVFGAYLKALKDRNRQAKAICVRVLSIRESARMLENSSYYNIFNGVEII